MIHSKNYKLKKYTMFEMGIFKIGKIVLKYAWFTGWCWKFETKSTQEWRAVCLIKTNFGPEVWLIDQLYNFFTKEAWVQGHGG